MGFWTKEPRHLCYNRLPLLADSVYDINYTGSGVTAQHTYPYRDPSLPGDIVFVKTDYLDWYLIHRKITVPITLVTGVSDLAPTPRACEQIIANPLITKWIGCNILVSHPKIIKVPIGVGEPERINGNHSVLKRLHESRVSWDEKLDNVCIPWCTKDNHVSRTINPTLPKLEFEDYMGEISKHKFVVCPRGYGIDTHRVCEVLLMGSVPVLEHSGLDDMYSQWPCLLVDSFESINTNTFIWDDTKYQAFLDIFWLKDSFKYKLFPPTPRVLILILASDTQPIYIEHQRLWRTYMKSNPNVDCYFYKGDPELDRQFSLVGDTLFIKIEETLETVYEKTLRAFEYFAPTFPTYKCIFRTNLSSVVIFDRYIEYCKTIPMEWFCSAFTGDFDGTTFPAGAGYTITPDIANKLVKERPPLIGQDDVSLGFALKDWGIPITSIKRVDFLNERYVNALWDCIPADVFHFRVKQNIRNETQIETPYEVDVMKRLIARYYGV